MAFVLAWARVRAKRFQDRVTGAIRVVAEDRAHRGIEVGAVGRLAEPLDLLAVAPDPVCPGELPHVRKIRSGIDIGVVADFHRISAGLRRQ